MYTYIVFGRGAGYGKQAAPAPGRAPLLEEHKANEQGQRRLLKNILERCLTRRGTLNLLDL